MPSLTFVLPHWLYWSALVLFPLIAMFLVRRQAGRADAGRANYFLAYLMLVTAGFVGMHRFYLRNALGLVFIPVFLAMLWATGQVREARETVSHARAGAEQAERLLARAGTPAARRQEGAEERIKVAEERAMQERAAYRAAQAGQADAGSHARIAAIVLGLMLLGDAFLLPGLVRRARATETLPEPVAGPMETALPDARVPVPDIPGIAAIDRMSGIIGELVAYWSVLAVFAYYYEVMARYIFNSPTNWVHESMFLMFGMQYMLAGAFAYREESHVRVDILYSQLSMRGRAICDLITSVFFFMFAGTMLFSGWRFAGDAIGVGEHSFSEWGVHYWPVKLSIPIGAALIILQGISHLARDAAIVARRAG